MKYFGLIGKPVSHSLSPIMMNSAFKALGYQGIYIAAEVDESELENAVRGLFALKFVGVNVTIPYKQNVMKLIDELTPQARAIGAVNTLKFDQDQGLIIGHNTDVSGWWTGVKDSVMNPPSEITVLGCGGGARAVVGALAQYTNRAKVTVCGRNERKCNEFVKDFAESLQIDAAPWEQRHDAISRADLVVNTTPIGMWPNIDECPVDELDCFHSGQVVTDIVYRPLVTQFLDRARQRGAVTIDGLSMLIHQGALAFEFWTGRPAPTGEMRQALTKHFGES